jgi:hypothetical protein
VTVNREGGGFVTSTSRERPGTDSSIVNAGPGAFFLDILAFSTDYLVTVEDCVGAPTERTGERPGPPERPPGRVDIPDDVVRDDPFIKIPDTGGPPVVLGALALLGAAMIVGRGVLRR